MFSLFLDNFSDLRTLYPMEMNAVCGGPMVEKWAGFDGKEPAGNLVLMLRMIEVIHDHCQTFLPYATEKHKNYSKCNISDRASGLKFRDSKSRPTNFTRCTFKIIKFNVARMKKGKLNLKICSHDSILSHNNSLECSRLFIKPYCTG